MSELKPCPFCGKTATLDYRVLPFGKHWFITCDRCGMMYQDVISQRKYVKDGWNTRPIEDELNRRIAELEEAYFIDETIVPDGSLKPSVRKLLERLEKAETDLSLSAGLIDSLIDRIAELEAVQRWIPVSERLPECEKDVLVFWGKALDGSKVDWFGTAWRNDSDDGKWCTDPIVPTHWMPLPESPNDTQTDSVVYGKDGSVGASYDVTAENVRFLTGKAEEEPADEIVF